MIDYSKKSALAIKVAVSVPGITGAEAAGMEAEKSAALRQEGFYTVPIGDALGARKVTNAIHEAFHAAMSIGRDEYLIQEAFR